jgi:hypothetical protein
MSRLAATILDEGTLRFAFEPAWQAVKWDDTATYRRGMGTLAGSKGTDFVGLHPDYGLLLLEVKDFRGHRIENRQRLLSGELAIEVACKARDTIAALVGAARHEKPEASLGDRLCQKTLPVKVVLWIESDEAVRDPRAWQQQLGVLSEHLEGKLKWLKVRCLAVSRRQFSDQIPDLIVTGLSSPALVEGGGVSG